MQFSCFCLVLISPPKYHHRISTFTAFVRAMKFMAIFIMYLGRVDTVVFSPGVGWFMDKFPLDGLPHCFLRDTLLHDAVSSLEDWTGNQFVIIPY